MFILKSLGLLVLSSSGRALQTQSCSQERHQACPLKQQRHFCKFQEMLLAAGIGIWVTGGQAVLLSTGTCLLWSWWSLSLFQRWIKELDDAILIFPPSATNILFWSLCHVRYLHDNSSVWGLPLALILFCRYLPQLLYLCLLYINATSKCPSWISPAMGKLVLHQQKHVFGLYLSSHFMRNSVVAQFYLWRIWKKKNLNLIVWKLAELSEFN